MADSWDDQLYSLTISSGGYRFYGQDPVPPRARVEISSDIVVVSTKIVQAVCSIESSCETSVETIKVKTVSSSAGADSSLSVQAMKESYAGSSIEGLSLTAIVSLEEAYGRVSISIENSVTVSAKEIVYASVSISGNSYDSSDVYDSNYPYDAALAASLTVFAGKLLEASSQTSGDLTCSVSSVRLGTVSSSISVEGAVLTLSEEIVHPEISISASCQVTVNALKFAYSSAVISADSLVSVSSIKFATANSDLSVESDSSATTLAIKYAAAVLDGTAFNVVVGKEILLARASISVLSSRLFVSPLRFSENVIEDTQSIRNLIVLDNKPLTEQNRTFSSGVDTQYVENINWNSLKSRYYKTNGIKRTFSISWSYIPNNRENTVDFKFGRDMIKSIANDPDVHTMKYLNIDSDGTTPRTEDEYEVIVKSYSERLVRRDLSSGVYFWDCNLELEEV